MTISICSRQSSAFLIRRTLAYAHFKEEVGFFMAQWDVEKECWFHEQKRSYCVPPSPWPAMNTSGCGLAAFGEGGFFFSLYNVPLRLQ